jgi:hypothetical protein
MINKSELSIGDIIKVTARKTKSFIVTDIDARSISIKGVDKWGIPEAVNGYRVRNKQIEDGMITEIVGKGKAASTSPAAARRDSSVPKIVSVTASKLIADKGIFEQQAVALLKSIAYGYSPENLSCDGEASRSQIAAVKRSLDTKWAAMEMYFGTKITNDLC